MNMMSKVDNQENFISPMKASCPNLVSLKEYWQINDETVFLKSIRTQNTCHTKLSGTSLAGTSKRRQDRKEIIIFPPLSSLSLLPILIDPSPTQKLLQPSFEKVECLRSPKCTYRHLCQMSQREVYPHQLTYLI